MDLSGFQMCHLSDDAHSILREKRVILGLTQQQVADKAKSCSAAVSEVRKRGTDNIMTCHLVLHAWRH